MDFLGIGPLELIVVAIIALIVVGPERLPELAQSVGKTLRDLRAMSEGLTSEWQQELGTLTDIDTGQGLKETLTRPFEEAQAEIQQVLDTPLTSPTKATSTKTTPSPLAPSEPPPEPQSEPASSEQPDTSDDEAASNPPAPSEPAPEPQSEPTSSEQPDTPDDEADHVDA
jgi:sec-independent protein translocase protein TatB